MYKINSKSYFFYSYMIIIYYIFVKKYISKNKKHSVLCIYYNLCINTLL